MKKSKNAKLLGILICAQHFQKSDLFIPIFLLIPSEDEFNLRLSVTSSQQLKVQQLDCESI